MSDDTTSTPQRTMSRRRFMGVIGTEFGAAALAAVWVMSSSESSAAQSAGTGNLTMSWWGPAARNTAYLSALTLFRQDDHVDVDPVYGGFSGYIAKLTTQLAGGGAPDVFQLTSGPPIDFLNKNVLLDFKPYIGKAMDVTNLDAQALNSTVWKGHQYVMAESISSTATYVNTTMLEKIGASLPPQETWTWADFATLAKNLAKESPKGVYGAADAWVPGGAERGTLEVFIRQRGKEMFTPQGTLGFTQEDLTEWYDLWADLRKAGAVTPPDITAASGDSDPTSPLIKRIAYIQSTFTGVLPGLQSLTQDVLDIRMNPNGPSGSRPGQYLLAGSPLAIYRNSKSPDLAVELVNFLVNSPKLDNLLGTVNGVPISTRRRNALKAHATGSTKKDLEYIDVLSHHSTPMGVIPPQGVTQFRTDILQNAHEDIAFGKVSIPQAVDRVFTWAKANLRPL